MKTRFLSALIFLCAVASAFSEPSEQEIIALMNKVQRGVAAGNVSALNELMTLPGRFAVSVRDIMGSHRHCVEAKLRKITPPQHEDEAKWEIPVLNQNTPNETPTNKKPARCNSHRSSLHFLHVRL